MAEERDPDPAFLDQPLPPRPEETVELSRLVEFWQHPARAFLRQRLDVATRTWEEEPDDALPVALDALQQWQVGDRVLAARLRGADLATVTAAETARGSLPPGRLGARVLSQVVARVDALLAASEQARAVEAETVDVEIDLPGGRRLVGTVSGVRGDVLLSVTYSSVRAKQRLKAWLELLALTLAQPDRAERALVVGRSKDGADPWSVGPVRPDDARAPLLDLVALRDLGLRTPLPLPPKTGEGYARRRGTGAVKEWRSGFDRSGEDDEPEHALCWGPKADVSVLFDWRSPDGGLGFPDLVGRVWGPLLAAEWGTS
jgi:exodeoxyribonuclease V gamma subunit